MVYSSVPGEVAKEVTKQAIREAIRKHESVNNVGTENNLW